MVYTPTMRVTAPHWLYITVDGALGHLLRTGQPHRTRVVQHHGETCIELLVLPDDVVDAEPADDCCRTGCCAVVGQAEPLPRDE